jgi:hypothetical protein
VRLYRERGTNSGVPYPLAMRAPVLLSAARAARGRTDEADALLERHEAEPIPELTQDSSCGPTAEVTEAMMGFPVGWTETC